MMTDSFADPTPPRRRDPYARAGSQRWLQVAVELRPDLLLSAIGPALGLPAGDEIEWVSPRAADGFREYRDREALRRIGAGPLRVRSLSGYWPRRGPVWDALGRTGSGRLVFVEAKANLAELASPPTKAGPESRAKIEAALAEARAYYAPGSSADWAGVHYQYANRLAHHYLFRELNGLPAELVFLYFTRAADVFGPVTPAGWHPALDALHGALGLRRGLQAGVHEVFLDASPLIKAAPPPEPITHPYPEAGDVALETLTQLDAERGPTVPGST